MTIEEYKRQVDGMGECVTTLKGILDVVEDVDDAAGHPGEPCPVASARAVGRIRQIIQDWEGRLCGGAPDAPGAPDAQDAQDGRTASAANNQQIHHTSYYKLPCGLFLEDFIDYKELDFKWGSAVKYEYRAGAKDGEPEDKDRGKRNHYICEIADRDHLPCDAVLGRVRKLVVEARGWDPPQKVRQWYAPYPTDWRPSDGR